MIRFLWDGERAETHWGKYFLKEYFNLQEIFLQFSFLRNYSKLWNLIKRLPGSLYVEELLPCAIWQKLTHENLGCIKIGMFFQKLIHLIVGKDGWMGCTDYERPMKHFLKLKSQTFGLGQTNWADNFWGIWGIFGWTFSTHVSTVSPLSMFFIIQPLFYKKLSHIFIWDWDLNLNLGRKELGI